MSQVPMTVKSKAKLDEELKQLKTVARPTVIQEIATARAHGDLSENAEYDAAKEKQAFIEGRIKDLEDKIARALVIDTSTIKSDKIVFGAIVELQDSDSEEKKVYHIVGSEEADIKLSLLSIDSPVARQLLNKKAGDAVTIKVPKGTVEYEVLSVKYE